MASADRTKRDMGSPDGRLGRAERDVLHLIAAGLGTGAITERLGCAPEDVQCRLAHAIATLSARSVPEAVELAARRGLIDPVAPRP